MEIKIELNNTGGTCQDDKYSLSDESSELALSVTDAESLSEMKFSFVFKLLVKINSIPANKVCQVQGRLVIRKSMV